MNKLIIGGLVIYTIIFALIAHFAYVSKAPEGQKGKRIGMSIGAYFGIPIGLVVFALLLAPPM